MTIKRLMFITGLIIIAAGCYIMMNRKFDPLARYQYYIDAKEHTLITSKLKQKEIEYLIEYAIAPYEFIDYIEYSGFNIYAIDEYNRLYQSYGWLESKEMIMRLVNATRNQYTYEQLDELINNYYFYEIVQYYEDGNTELLAVGVNAIDFVIPNDRTVGYLTPKDLVISSIKGIDDSEIYLRQEASDALDEMIGDLKIAYNRQYQNLRLSSGFIAYQQLVDLYNTSKQDRYKPGHSEYQLGLAVQFAIKGVSDDEYVNQALAQWLKNNAYLYGFVQTDREYEVENAYRYVGKQKALSLNEIVAQD